MKLSSNNDPASRINNRFAIEIGVHFVAQSQSGSNLYSLAGVRFLGGVFYVFKVASRNYDTNC